MVKFKVSPEELKQLVERAKKEAARQVNIISGVEKKLIVFDAMERINDVKIAVYDPGEKKMKIMHVSKLFGNGDAVAKMINLLSEMKNVEITAKVLGNRVMAILDVEEYSEGWSKEHGIGTGTVIKRSGRVWLDTVEGMKLVSDYSIKGALLADAAVDGDTVVYIGIETVAGSGVPLIQFIDWDIIERRGEETNEDVVTAVETSGVEDFEIPSDEELKQLEQQIEG